MGSLRDFYSSSQLEGCLIVFKTARIVRQAGYELQERVRSGVGVE